jgi:hypothetical protein
MISRIRIAALPVRLNTAERVSRKAETKRKLIYEISQDSVFEMDAALNFAGDFNYLWSDNTFKLG